MSMYRMKPPRRRKDIFYSSFLRYFLGLAILVLALILVLPQRKERIEEKPCLFFTQWWEEEMETDSLRALIREFEERRPDITIVLDTRPYSEIRDQLVYKKGGDEAAFSPDILGLDPSWLYELVESGFLENLDGYQGKSAEDTSLSPSWALPVADTMDVLFYNIDILQAAGFDRPPKDRETFSRIARAVTNAAQDRYGLTLALGAENPQAVYTDFFPWFWAGGIPLFQEGQIRYDTPQGIDTLEFLADLYRNDLVVPGSFVKKTVEKREEFISGKAAMMIGSASDISTCQERGLHFGVTTVPGPASYIGKPVFGLRGWYAGLNRESKYKAEAWDFLCFLTEKRFQISKAARAVPGGRTAEDYINTDPLYSKIYDIYEIGEALEEFTRVPKMRDTENIFREALYRLLEEGQSSTAAARAIQQALEKGALEG